MAWLVWRARPYSLGSVVRAVVRNLTVNPARRRALAPLLASGSGA
jgi:hypothetical protein